MKKNTEAKFINRELSWLEFNQRVLNEALDDSVPLLERLMFLSITASNLDEFLMVRVGGLKLMIEQNVRKKDPAGMTPRQQLKSVSDRIRSMINDQYECFGELLLPLLRRNDIAHTGQIIPVPEQEAYIENYFNETVYPTITPMAVDDKADFPLLQNLGLNIAVRLASKEETSACSFAVIPISRNLNRFIALPGSKGYSYALVESVILSHINAFFPGIPVLEAIPFRITRNADLSAREDLTPDFLAEMEFILKMRKTSGCVRLETGRGVSKTLLRFLQKGYGITDTDTYHIPGPLDLSAFSQIASMDEFPHLRYQPWEPQPSPDIDINNSIFDEIAGKDILLYHPFDSYEPVLRLVEEAAEDPDVLAIKQTLYRTGAPSRVMAALEKAVENGKHVTAIIELKARFDEAVNIQRARDLEASGAQIIYGIKGLKTHSKICIVVRKEKNSITRYVHYGTGNYNEKTARLYTDASLLTCDPDLGKDASTFFNTVSGYSEPQKFLKISSAPIGLRETLLSLIGDEAERSRQGQKGLIMAKMNSLVDPEIINALYRASCSGVKIRLNVRGICCLYAGIKNLSGNISVVSIIDRFLEHSRIFYFLHGGNEQIFISSADWMPRNLDRRVELMIPVDDHKCRQQLKHILETCLNDTIKGYKLQPGGTYKRTSPAGKKHKPSRSQEILFREACSRVVSAKETMHKIFELHRPKKQTHKKK